MHRSLRSRFRNISPRDAILILLGAASMHLFSSFSPHFQASSSLIFDTHSSQDSLRNIPRPLQTILDSWHPPVRPPTTAPSIPDFGHEIPQTELVSHAPGWTIFRNLYMADGTLFIVTSKPESFPSIDLMTSTGLPSTDSPESVAERMPTSSDMSVISPEEAHQRWGGQSMLELNNVFPVEGSTVRPPTPSSRSSLTSEFYQLLFNDPGQCTSSSFLFTRTLTITWKQSSIITTTFVRNFFLVLGPFGTVPFGAILPLPLYHP